VTNTLVGHAALSLAHATLTTQAKPRAGETAGGDGAPGLADPGRQEGRASVVCQVLAGDVTVVKAECWWSAFASEPGDERTPGEIEAEARRARRARCTAFEDR
jgi:hypothetical protein